VVGALTHHQLQATCVKDSGGGLKTLAPFRSPEGSPAIGIKVNIKALCRLPSAFLVDERNCSFRGLRVQGFNHP
jgi:hypothetical protein